MVSLKKGNYLFKFVGVLKEHTFENLRNYSDEVYIHEDKIEYIQEYNERINTNNRKSCFITDNCFK